MRNSRLHLPFSLTSLASGTVIVLFVTYIALIAIIMSYAALTIEFSQSVKTDQASVAILEGQYLAALAQITSTNYVAEGYVVPSGELYVKAQSATALR
jgi:hypothetical protein